MYNVNLNKKIVFDKTVVVSITPDTYYECEQYPGAQWDQIDKTRRECMRENVDGVDLIFCRHWECAKLTCPEEEQLTWMDGWMQIMSRYDLKDWFLQHYQNQLILFVLTVLPRILL